MLTLRLLGIFIFSTLLTGCGIADDVKQLKEDIAEFKQDIKLLKERAIPLIKALVGAQGPPPCKPPDQHSTNSCAYKLHILKVLPNNQYQGEVPQSVVDTQNDDCQKHKPTGAICPTSGDRRPHTFTVDGPQNFKESDVVVCVSDPNTDHLKNCTKAT